MNVTCNIDRRGKTLKGGARLMQAQKKKHIVVQQPTSKT